MIVPIGNKLIEDICQQIRYWKALSGNQISANEFHISFNLSAVQIYRSDVVGQIKYSLKKNKLSSDYLYAEITETLLLKDEDKAQTVLEQLQETGLKVWLDDFGTGYSSLAYLRRFAIDGIKIDRCFINELTTSDKEQKLVEAIIALADKLNVGVIAEGIESDEQLKYLRRYSCPFGQGYYFSKPLPADKFENLLLNQNLI